MLERAYKSSEKLIGSMDRLQTSLNKGLTPPVNASQKLNKTLSDSAKSAVEADKALSKFGVSAGLSFAKFNLLAGVVEGAGRGVAGFASNIVTLGAGLESVETNFTTFLGSADAAKALISELNKFAAETPFSQNEIFAQSEKLLGFGFAADEVTDTLRRLGDISGGSAEKLDGLVLALGQVRAKQRVQGEELLQFAERGVPIYDALAQAIGKSVPETQELVTKGKVGFADLQNAIALLTDEGGQFNGVLAAQSQTLTGLFSTLTGNFEQLQGELGKKLLPFLKDVVIEANNIISAIDPQAIADTFSEAGQVAAPFVDAIKQGFSEDILPALLRFRDTIQGVIDKFGDFFDGINAQGAVVEFLKSVIEGVTFAFGLLVDSISFAVDAVSDFVSPIVNALAPAVNTLLRVFSGVIEKIAEFKVESTDAGSAFDDLAKPATTLATALATIVEVIGEVVAGVINLGDAARSSTPWIRGIGDAAEFITIPLRAILGTLSDLIGRFAEFTGLAETEAEKQLRLQKELFDKQAKAEDEFRNRERGGDEFRTDAQIATELARQKELERKKLEQQKAASQKSQSELDKAEKERQKLLEERQKLRLSLIEDETQKASELEKVRYQEQLADIKRLTKGDDQLRYDQEQAALRIHKANLDEIEQDAADKVKDRNDKILDQERKFQDERNQVRADIEKAKQDNADVLFDTEINLLESTQNLVLAKMRKRGDDEAKIKEAELLFSAAIDKRIIENELKAKEAEYLAVSAKNKEIEERFGRDASQAGEERARVLALEIATLNNELATLQLEAPEPKKKLSIKDFFEDFKGSLAEVLGLTPETFNGLFDDAKSAFGSFFDSIKSLSDLQIEQNNRVIESLNERISETQKALEREQADKEKGYANDVETQQAALDALNAQKEAAEQKNRELQAKQTRFQLLQDTATQVSGIATSVVNIIKGTSAIPFVGIALAAVQVAALFALLASARAQSRAATRLHTGGRIPWGKTDEDGKQGYMIEDTGVMVGGNEWVINRKVSDEHDPFLKKLNAGKYKGVDLEELADGAKKRTHTRETILNEIVTHVLKRVHRGQTEHAQMFGESERFEKTRVVETKDIEKHLNIKKEIERLNKLQHSATAQRFDVHEITNYLNEKSATVKHLNIKEEIEMLRKSQRSTTSQRFDVDQVSNYLNEKSQTTKRINIRDEIETLNKLQHSKELQRFDIEEITNYLNEKSRVENTKVFELVGIAKHLIERNNAEKTHVTDLTDIAKRLNIKEESEVFRQLKRSATAQRFDIEEITNHLTERSRVEKTRVFELNDIAKYLKIREEIEHLKKLQHIAETRHSTRAKRFNVEETKNQLIDIAKSLNIREGSEVFRMLQHSKELQHSAISQRFDIEEIVNHLSEKGRVELEKVMYINEQTRRTREVQTELVRDLFVKQSKVQIPDFSSAIEFQAARINRAANTINVHNTNITNQQAKQAGNGGGITAKEVKKMLEENTNRLLRAGFLPLHQLGQRTVGPDGTETHYQIDPALNTRTTVKKK